MNQRRLTLTTDTTASVRQIEFCRPITAQRQNNQTEDIGDPIHLIGDGTPGGGRDALADGANDFFEWDIRGVRVGDYVIIATIEAPDAPPITCLL